MKNCLVRCPECDNPLKRVIEYMSSCERKKPIYECLNKDCCNYSGGRPTIDDFHAKVMVLENY